MRYRLILVAVALATVGSAAVAVAGTRAGPEASAGGREALGGGGYGRGYFAVVCGFSHRNQDDPIVFFRQPGRSHDHTYFGNTATRASSTPASLRASGQTTCRLRADTAAYWAPTLFLSGRAVEPRGVIAYYLRRTFDDVRPFPAGLKVIAGRAAARRAQGDQITYWRCTSRRDDERSSTIPTCSSSRSTLQLVVKFPNCWDGRRLDSANHQSHMAYSVDGRCAASHPVEVPMLALVIYYGISRATDAELASGGQFSGHADFINSWNQPTLAALVDRYLNRSGRGRRP